MFKHKENLLSNLGLLTGTVIISGFTVFTLIKSVTRVNAAAPCIITLYGQQYDVAPLQPTGAHAGGDVFICGTDMTALYQSQHGTSVSRMDPYLVISPTATPTVSVSPTVTPDPSISPTPTVVPTVMPVTSLSPTATPSVKSHHDEDDNDTEEHEGERNDDSEKHENEHRELRGDNRSERGQLRGQNEFHQSSNSRLKAGDRDQHDD